MKNVMMVAVAVSAVASFSASADNCGQYGCPTGGVATNQVIERPIYTLSNNAQTKFADWVAYQVTPQTIDGGSRTRTWRADPQLPENATLEPSDYKGAHATIGTDRGHQVPLASFSNTHYWSTTNYLSNITPQSSDLNQGPWVKLENAVRGAVRNGNSVYVITGPLYEYDFATLPEADEEHFVPSGYFKVVATISNTGWINASGFIMEQTAGRRDDYCRTEVTIDEIEYRSGLNFFPTLASNVENSVEARTGGLTRLMNCQ
ncbi:DNA/RNA non-specific endonuclease [Parashewanella curva]|uniref:Endonuclease n=1 Tax=Parashewanella curva TaxID=2338552 RepID=A0A3L8PVQ6_9GAMM|nr:DNA/RNA non-specific endonuclease [Parashewanella curva]RLV59517.1 DNA/RNA non-specific endonuclease [Parashewanella curva]